jgi:hypothetical protein
VLSHLLLPRSPLMRFVQLYIWSILNRWSCLIFFNTASLGQKRKKTLNLQYLRWFDHKRLNEYTVMILVITRFYKYLPTIVVSYLRLTLRVNYTLSYNILLITDSSYTLRGFYSNHILKIPNTIFKFFVCTLHVY